MRKFLSIIMSALIVCTLTCPAFASASDDRTLDAANLSVQEICKKLEDKSIYITLVDYNSIEHNEYAREEMRREVSAAIQTQQANNDISSRETKIASDTYYIEKLNSTEVQVIASHPAFKPILARYAELLDEGVHLNNIRLYAYTHGTPNANELSAFMSANLADSAYWTKTFFEFAAYGSEYDGYKFLYAEGEADASTELVEPDNLTRNFNWGDFFTSMLEMAGEQITEYIEEEVEEVILFPAQIISAFSSSYDGPLVNYSYGEHEDDEFLTMFSGDLLTRTVLIEDRLDTIPEYAYVPWGITEGLYGQQEIQARVPIREDGGIKHRPLKSTGEILEPSCPGFDGSKNLYERTIYEYENTSGFDHYCEYFDVNSFVIKLITK